MVSIYPLLLELVQLFIGSFHWFRIVFESVFPLEAHVLHTDRWHPVTVVHIPNCVPLFVMGVKF